MAQQQIDNTHSPTKSKLESFNLGFEYDKTIQQVKRDVRFRTF